MKVQLVFLFLLFLTFGCTELSRQEKNLCENLTNTSFAYVPTCSTTEACYDKVDLIFKTDFDYFIEDRLYVLKNHLARSWMYYDKTKKEMKKISESCEKSDIQSLPGQINQMKYYLSQAFLELDQASQESFNIVQTKEQELEQKDTTLIPEEALYYSSIELKQILSELKNGRTNSNSYISYYLSKVDEFNTKSFYKGYPELIEETPFWLSGAITLQKTIASEKEKILFPFIQQGFENIFSYLETKFYINESLRALENFPANEVIKLYSDIGGTQNSAIKRFADLINKININEKETKSKIPLLWQDVEQTSEQIKLILEKEQITQKYVDLARDLLENKIEIDKNDFVIFGEIIKSINELKKAKSEEKLSLGREISSLKDVLVNEKRLLLSLETQTSSKQELLEKACEEKAKYKLADTHPITLEHIALEINYLKKEVNGNFGEKKLYYCKQLTQNIYDYEEGLLNYALFEAKKIDKTKECFSFLEQALKNIELYELKALFEKLKQETVTKDNIIYFSDACEEIKQQVIKETLDNPKIKEAQTEYLKLEELMKKYWIASAYIQTKNFVKEKEKLETYLSSIKNYFEESEINNLSLLKTELTLKNQTQHDESLLVLDSETLAYIQDNVSFKTIEQTTNTAVGKLKIKTRMTLSNPFWEMKDKTITIRKINGKTIDKSPVIKDIVFGENTQIITLVLPKGKTQADLEIETEVYFEEKDDFIYVTTQTSLIKREIRITCESNGLFVTVETNKPGQTKRIQIYLQGQEINYVEKDEKIIFEAETGQTMTLFFYITGLLKSEINLVEQQQLSEQTEKRTYLLVVQNLTNNTLAGSIIFDVPINSFVESIKVYDEIRTEKKEALINDQILLKNQEFGPKQIREFYLVLTINGIFDYYKQSLREMLPFLDEKNDLLIQKINFFLNLPFSQEALTTGEKLLSETQLTVKKTNEDKENERTKELIREKLDEEINRLQTKIDLLLKMGLEQEAEKINSLIQTVQLQRESNDITQLTSSFDLINNTKTTLFKEAKEEVDKIWKEIQKDNFSEEGLLKMKEIINQKKDLFDKLYLMDAEKSFEQYVEIKNNYNLYLLEKQRIEEENSKKSISNIEEINKLKKECLTLISLLNGELFEKEDDLIQAKFITPITYQRLEKIKLAVNSLSEKEESLTKLNDYLVELSLAYDKIRKETILKYNSSIDEKKDSSILSKAKLEIDKNNYVNAYLILSQTKQENSFNYLNLIPIIILVVVGFFIKKYSDRQKKGEKNKTKEITSAWNEP